MSLMEGLPKEVDNEPADSEKRKINIYKKKGALESQLGLIDREIFAKKSPKT